MKTVFYAWQSDLDGRSNRHFIEDCLERAIKQINRTRASDNQLSLDKDTQNHSGMPDIARVIFDKIDTCAVFVPDLSFTAHTASGEPVPNPNVLLELGYALRAIGDERIVSVFNEVTGAREALPFDLRTRRWPIPYALKQGFTREERQEARDKIVPILVVGLTAAAARAGIADVDEPVRGQQSFGFGGYELQGRFPDGQVLAQLDPGPPGTGADGKVKWRNGTQASIDVRPKQEKATDAFTVLKSLAIKPDYQLKAFGSHDTPWHERNTYGFIAGHVISHPRQPLSVCFTQLFRNNGGLYGINQNIATEEGERRVIDGDRLRREFEEALENYLEFYRRHPEFGDSVSVYLQLESIHGVFLKVRTPEGLQRIGPVIDPLLSDGAQNIPLDADVKSILRPLFVKLWDNAGVEYTD